MNSYVNIAEALSVIQSGNRVFIHGGAGTPIAMLHALSLQKDRLHNVEIVSILLTGEDIYLDKPEYEGHFHLNSLFVSGAIRRLVNSGYADYIPAFLSEIPMMFTKGILPLDVAIVMVSEPDEQGYCSLGGGVDIALAAINSAKYVIAQVNPSVPRTYGDGNISASRFCAMVYCEEPLPEISFGNSPSGENLQIAHHVAGLIEDRSALQIGIGEIPEAVLQNLYHHKDLGLHTEMCSDGVVGLCEKGIITNKYKKTNTGLSVIGFALGTKKLYNFLHNNDSFRVLDTAYVNDPAVIRQNDRVVSVNSAIEIDITGQICADSIGTYHYSGVGGQVDFIRGATLSKGGKPIIAMCSRTAKGIARIVPVLKSGAGVVTTRAHAHYVVTEYGVAYLYGKNLRQRAKALINIAHPDDREALEKACFERFKIFQLNGDEKLVEGIN